MASSIVYVDHSMVREGKLDELKPAINGLVDFVAANEPDIVAYAVHFNEDGSRMTVMHIHRDQDSLEFHMKIAGPLFPKFADFVELLSIDVYGEIGAGLVDQLRKKAGMLGTATVTIHPLHGGMTRF